MFLQTIGVCAIAVLLYMTVFYLVALLQKNNSIADIAWGPGVSVVAFVALFVNGMTQSRQFLITTLVLLWGIRLAVHIFLRNSGKSEDFRYKQWRQKWGRQWRIKSYLYVFVVQGFFMLLVS